MSSEVQPTPALPRVIFIRGITRRSGTNYLFDLVRLHPQCVRARTDIWEDFALDDAELLDRYITRLSQRFPPQWPVPRDELRGQLLREFGDALHRSLIENPKRPGAVPVAKTPSARGLEYFFDLFPDEPLLIIVRDGRAAAESLMRSFDLSFDRAVGEWVEGADAILRFRRKHAATEGKRWLLLRYEEILHDPISAVARIATVSGLEPDAVNLEAARELPVRGSSSFQTEEGSVHWKPVEKDESFKPLERASTWDEPQHRRFNWMAGEQMTQLGYDLAGASERPLADWVRQPVRDVYDAADAAARRLRRGWLFRGLDAKVRRDRAGL